MNTHCVCTVLQTVSFLTSTLNNVQHSLNVFPLWKDRSVFRPLFISRAASPLPLSGKNPLIALGFASDRLFCLCRERFCRIFVQSIPAGVQLRPFVRGFDKRVCGRPVTFSRPVTVFFVPWLAGNQQSPVIRWNQNQPGWIGRLRTSTKLLSLKTFWVLRWFASMSQLVNPPAEESTIKLMMMRKIKGNWDSEEYAPGGRCGVGPIPIWITWCAPIWLILDRCLPFLRRKSQDHHLHWHSINFDSFINRDKNYIF